MTITSAHRYVVVLSRPSTTGSAADRGSMTSKVSKVCTNCEEDFLAWRSSKGLYCSNKCQKDFEYKDKVAKWKRGEISGTNGKALQIAPWLRRYIFESRGTACSKCGWNEVHPVDGLPLTELDHIDGDASNTTEENIRVLCPNCHSMTPNFRARNSKSARSRCS